ncbi:MAG: shikimate kinase [Planctomycetota bacterium]
MNARKALGSELLFLCGYRACGKTSVAKHLSELTDVQWVDTDDEIQEEAGQSVAEIFANEGEAGFRARETATIERLIGEFKSDRMIFSLGGGAILAERNRELIKSSGGPCVWLKASVETVLTRMDQDAKSASQRPALTDLDAAEEVRRVLAARTPIYEEMANHIVDTDLLTIEEITADVRQFLKW